MDFTSLLVINHTLLVSFMLAITYVALIEILILELLAPIGSKQILFRAWEEQAVASTVCTWVKKMDRALVVSLLITSWSKIEQKNILKNHCLFPCGQPFIQWGRLES